MGVDSVVKQGSGIDLELQNMVRVKGKQTIKDPNANIYVSLGRVPSHCLFFSSHFLLL